ncbi:MAG: lipid A biosynthesis acyltransferase [Nannocystaceae bacterium]
MTEVANNANAAAQPDWRNQPERGSALGIRFTVWAARFLGRSVARFMLAIVAFYFTLFAGAARRASGDYLQRMGEPCGFWASYRHIRTFAFVALDRIFFVGGEVSRFKTGHTGVEHLMELRRQGRGALLLGAHLGSFEAMRALGSDEAFAINILVYWKNARMITQFLEQVGGDFRGRVIEINPEDPSYVFAVRDAIEAGEMVAILGDRVAEGEKSVVVPFLGQPARFPAGPYLLASVLKCPIYLTFGLYREGATYDLFCEPLAERVVLPRGQREVAAAHYAEQYATRLEAFCRKAPTNWFNFFDFWASAARALPEDPASQG